MSLLNGLATLGQGVSAFAGQAANEQLKSDREIALQQGQQGFLAGQQERTQTFQTGLEQQKADLATQAAVLADQLATTRGIGLKGYEAQIAETAAEKQRDFELQKQAIQLHAQATMPTPQEREINAYTGGATPGSPEYRQGVRELAAAKAGTPLWMLGGETPNPIQAPSSTAPPAAAPSGSGASNTSAAPAPGVTGKPDQSTPPDNLPPPKYDLSTLQDKPPAVTAIVKAMLEGRQSPPTGAALRDPKSPWGAYLALAHMADPDFDETTWKGRAATRLAFLKGPEAHQITAVDTALLHMGTLSRKFDELDNSGLGPLVNYPVNNALALIGQAPTFKSTKEVVGAVASEMRKVYQAGGGGNLTELKQWEDNFPVNGSPKEQRAALDTAVELLDGKLIPLTNQYNRGMGTTSQPFHLLDPGPATVYQQLHGQAPPPTIGYQRGNAGSDGTAAPPLPSKPLADPLGIR